MTKKWLELRLTSVEERTERELALLKVMTMIFVTAEAKVKLEVRLLLNVLLPPRKLSEKNNLAVEKALYLLVYLTNWSPTNKYV
jgi:hypothetical protein|tara:strand:- start:143 stop:394 length:252 start_codon:yes stop_codon:yes gene_type:complete